MVSCSLVGSDEECREVRRVQLPPLARAMHGEHCSIRIGSLLYHIANK